MSTFTDRGQRLLARVRVLPPRAVDGAVALLCAVLVIVQAGIEGTFDWWVAALATANAAPLLWRRQQPFWTALAVGISTTWLAVADRLGDLPAAQLVATYTFAALCPPMQRLIAGAGTVIGISVSVLVPDDGALNLGRAGILFAVAYALGTAARAHRDRIELLEERTRRLAEQRGAAAARERERIAREMHDILAHSMSLVVVQAEAGPVAVRRDPDRAAQMFDTISDTARDALAQLRRVLGVLRSDEADRGPAPDLDALPELIAHVRGSGVDASLTEHGERRVVPADLAAVVHRVVQEALTNTIKHADATTVQVRLDWRDDELGIEVTDDGHGPVANDHGGGYGLAGMRERVATVGGGLEHGPAHEGKGFRITARLPLQ